MATKEQERSAFALQKIDERFGQAIEKEHANFIVGVPTMILTNGIAQTMAFLLSKKKKKENDPPTIHEVVFGIIKEWLSLQFDFLRKQSNMDFLLCFSKISDNSKYLAAQNESIAMLQWLKRYARAFQVEDRNERHP